MRVSSGNHALQARLTLTRQNLKFGFGPGALLANGVLLYVILAWLAGAAENPLDRIFLLSAGNFGLAALLLLPKMRGGPLLKDAKTSAALLGWSITYSIIYGAFVRWPDTIPIWTMVAAKACAPLVGIFISGDDSRDAGPLAGKVLCTAPIILLLTISFLEWSSSRHVGAAPLIATSLALLFGLSQTCARIVARGAPNPTWGPPRLALLNGVLLLMFWVAVGPAKVHGAKFTLLGSAALLSIGILALQAAYLFGIANTPPFLSGLLLGAGVPISILGDHILKTGAKHNPLSLLVSIGFCVSMGLVTWTSLRFSEGTSGVIGPQEQG
jgi:hypothetical protein